MKALVGAYSVIVKLRVIFGNLRFKLYYLFLFLPRSARARAATTTWSRFPLVWVCSRGPWHWLTSRAAAEEMAEKVARWPEQYGCDGIDLDLEEGAGSNKVAGPNMVHFVRKLKELAPGIIVSQPTYGYPQVQAEIDVINASWDDQGNSNNVADSTGLMVYEGTQAMQYVKNYVSGADQWAGAAAASLSSAGCPRTRFCWGPRAPPPRRPSRSWRTRP